MLGSVLYPKPYDTGFLQCFDCCRSTLILNSLVMFSHVYMTRHSAAQSTTVKSSNQSKLSHGTQNQIIGFSQDQMTQTRGLMVQWQPSTANYGTPGHNYFAAFNHEFVVFFPPSCTSMLNSTCLCTGAGSGGRRNGRRAVLHGAA